jgi:hypothetical protein
MRTTGVIATAAGFTCLMIATAAQAELHGRNLDNDPATFEAWYDDVLDITWLADANYARTSGHDADGMMDWPAATAWVKSLDYFGVTGWRLPAVAPLNGSTYDHTFSNNGTTDVGFASRGTLSELADLYCVTLGNKGLCKPDDADPGSQVIGTSSPVLAVTLLNRGAMSFAVLGVNLGGHGFEVLRAVARLPGKPRPGRLLHDRGHLHADGPRQQDRQALCRDQCHGYAARRLPVRRGRAAALNAGHAAR